MTAREELPALAPQLAQALLAHWPQGASPAVRTLIERLVVAAAEGHAWIELGDDPLALDALAAWSGAGPADGGLRPVVIDGTQAALRRWWSHEQRVARALARLAASPRGGAGDGAPERGGAEGGNDAQARAIANARRSAVSVVLGGPGTGKTWTVARMLETWFADASDAAPRVALAAPTGKAAARLGEAVQGAILAPRLALPRAQTLHALLGASRSGGTWRHHAAAPLVADIVVVDEVSMVDLELMVRLLEAIPQGARLVLLGDPDQLAAVETGAVLAELRRVAAAGWLARVLPGLALVTLTQSYRYAPDGALGRMIGAVAAGQAEAALDLLASGSADLTWIDASGEDRRRLRRRLAEGLCGAWPAEVDKPQIVGLAPTYAGALGVDALNAEVAGLLGREGESYVDGQPLLVVANDAASELANGDLGRVERVAGGWRVRFGGGATARHLAPGRLPSTRDAWAMTVHKAQGSEFDRVIVVVPEHTSPLSSRQWLYTALSRARRAATVVGDREAVRAAVLNDQGRRSRLAERLAELGRVEDAPLDP